MAESESTVVGGDTAEMSIASLTSSMFSSVRSSSTMIESEGFVPRTKICLIGADIDTTAEAAAECFELPVVKSLTGEEYLDDPSVLLVVTDFRSSYVERLMNIKWRVVGVAAMIDCANEFKPLPIKKRPIYSFTMSGVVTCFTGIRDRMLAGELMFLIRSMGGSVRQEPNRETTHIIATTTTGKKYEYAVTFMVPIMSPEWVWESWKMRDVHGVFATDEQLMVHRQKPFLDVFASFIGFPKLEYDDMEMLLKSHGGVAVTPVDPRCTHIVADDISPVVVPAGASSSAVLVRADWFWLSIQQVNRAAEADYAVSEERFRRVPRRGSTKQRGSVRTWVHCKENVDPNGTAKNPRHRNLRRASLASIPSPDRTVTNSPRSCASPLMATARGPKTPDGTLTNSPGWPRYSPGTPTTPTTPELYAERTLRQPCVADGDDPPILPYSPAGTPRSRRGTPRRTLGTPLQPSAPPLSNPGTPLRPSAPPLSSPSSSRKRQRRVSLDSVAAQPVSPRFGAFLELMHTEENYVGILDTILQMRSEALSSSQAGGVLLTQTEAKIIFGALMPIARTHHAILKDLRFIHNNWSETANIGEVFQKYSPNLLRDYAPFVSSFEDSKDMLQQASERNPRFHAFLKICRGKPECGRQELHELMIRPVQRLGSCKLLLREILKHTPEGSPDRGQLESALDSLSHVLSLINEDKRKMESLCKVFDIFNLIDKCPADVIASHRSLLVECEGVELTTHGFGKQGKHVAFFVFTDVILVCKKKAKVVALMKGQPGSNIPHRVLKAVRGKPYKFLQCLPLSTIKKVVDVADSENVTNALGLVFRGKTEIRESCSYFKLQDGEGAPDKALLLERWSCALATHNCVADPATFVHRESAEEAGIQSSTELFAKQIHKAAQMAAKTQVLMSSALGLGRSQSTKTCSSPPCVMSSFNSTSRLETVSVGLLGKSEDDDSMEKPKPSSLTANIMKRM